MSARIPALSRPRLFALACLLPCLTLGVPACDRKPQTPPAPPPVMVTVSPAELGNAPLTLSGVGNVQALRTVAVRPQVTGILLKTHFTEGSEVKAGDLLFTLDPEPFLAKVRQAEAARGKNKAVADQSGRDYRRYADLVKKEVVSQDDYEKTMTSADSTKMQVRQDEADITTARINLGYTQIRSPATGVAGYQKFKTGNLVTANTDVMVTINQIEPVFVKFSIPERDLPLLRRYMGQGAIPARVFVPGNPDIREEGTVTAIDNAVDPATGMIQVQAEFPNKSKTLWPGQFVTVTVSLDVEQGVLLIPSDAVIQQRGGVLAFVAAGNNTADLRRLTVGRSVGGKTVVLSGLAPGDRVVLDGIIRLRPGSPLKVKGDAAPAKGSSAQ